jgi:hypothetical protein
LGRPDEAAVSEVELKSILVAFKPHEKRSQTKT